MPKHVAIEVIVMSCIVIEFLRFFERKYYFEIHGSNKKMPLRVLRIMLSTKKKIWEGTMQDSYRQLFINIEFMGAGVKCWKY